MFLLTGTISTCCSEVPPKEKFMVVYGGKNKHLLRQTGKIESRLQLNQLPPPLERLRVLGWPHFSATVNVAAL